MIFDKVHLLFRTRIRILNLKLRIRILQKVSDPYGSGSTTLIQYITRASGDQDSGNDSQEEEEEEPMVEEQEKEKEVPASKRPRQELSQQETAILQPPPAQAKEKIQVSSSRET
jgi:hypothetical protein